jgi:hypothetical protein
MCYKKTKEKLAEVRQSKQTVLYTYRHDISYTLAGVPFVILNCNWSILLYSF